MSSIIFNGRAHYAKRDAMLEVVNNQLVVSNLSHPADGVIKKERSNKMKKIILMLPVILFLTACKEKPEVCQCDVDQVYNAKTGECDCVQPFPESERPVLKTDGYNSWYAVKKHFTYSVKYKYYNSYPYFSHEGDTLLLNGWIDHTPLEERAYSVDSTLVKISLFDDSVSAAKCTNYDEYFHYIACPATLLEKINADKIIHLKGTLTFNFNDVFFDEVCSPSNPDKDCWFVRFAVKVVEIKN